MTQRTLDKLRRRWQKILKLSDWHVTSKFVNKIDWPERMDDAVGFNEILLDSKESRISILWPEELEGDWKHRAEDVENTLVHELIHCHFQPYMAEREPTCTLQEQTIDALTAALLAVDRNKPGRRVRRRVKVASTSAKRVAPKKSK